MKDRKLDEIEIDVLAHLLEKGEQRFVEIAESIFPRHAKTFQQDENHFKVVLVRKLDRLREDGLIEKKVLSNKNVRYSIPTVEKAEIAKKIKHLKNLEFLAKLPPEEIDKLLKENERLKRLNRIHELESKGFFPVLAVIKKLVDEHGFKIEDFYEKDQLEDPAVKQFIKNFYKGIYEHIVYPKRLVMCHLSGTPAEELAEKDNIEIKLIPSIHYDDEFYKRFSGWIELTTWDEPINGYHIFAAWKELLRLYVEQFEDDWLKWKEQFKISDEDWKKAGPAVAFLMMFDKGREDLSFEIATYLHEFAKNKSSEALKSAEEIWREVGEDIAKYGIEKWQRIFQYLKAKYGAR